jgi:hypothetical protein
VHLADLGKVAKSIGPLCAVLFYMYKIGDIFFASLCIVVLLGAKISISTDMNVDNL